MHEIELPKLGVYQFIFINHCSTFNLRNIGRNKYLLILKKEHKSSFSRVLSSIFKIVCQAFVSKIINV